MRIGELSERSGVSARLLRYYEEQDLLKPKRDNSGYRDYPESMVSLAAQIRELIESGLTTEIIRQILPCVIEHNSAILPRFPEHAVAQLREHQAKIAARICCLTATHGAIDSYLDAVAKRQEEMLQATNS